MNYMLNTFLSGKAHVRLRKEYIDMTSVAFPYLN